MPPLAALLPALATLAAPAAQSGGNDIAFLKDFVADWGFWPLTLCCMVPMAAFVLYVAAHDALAARRHRHH